MSHTNLVLGANWPSEEWPESVDVMHEGAGDNLRYVPERTCKMELVKSGPIYSVWRFSCCGFYFSENITDSGATELPGTRCPKCGAVVDDER